MPAYCDYCRADPGVLFFDLIVFVLIILLFYCLIQHVSDGFNKALYLFEKPETTDDVKVTVTETADAVKTVGVNAFNQQILTHNNRCHQLN